MKSFRPYQSSAKAWKIYSLLLVVVAILLVINSINQYMQTRNNWSMVAAVGFSLLAIGIIADTIKKDRYIVRRKKK